MEPVDRSDRATLLTGRRRLPAGLPIPSRECSDFSSTQYHLLKGGKSDFCTFEVQRITEKYKEVPKKYALSLRFISTNRAKMFCYYAMSKTLFPITEQSCSSF